MKGFLVALSAVLALGGCHVVSWSHPGKDSGHPHHHNHGGPPEAPGHGEGVPPQRVSMIKMISWAEASSKPCETDLEGSAPPARFTLRYSEAGQAPVVIENDPEQLFGAAWGIITRSARGMGFEKAGEFISLDFDMIEELQCRCEKKTGDWKGNALVRVKLEWKPGSVPSVTAEFQGEKGYEPVTPITMNGRLPMWEFRFARPFPDGNGECASRFLMALGVDQPLE